MQLSDIANLSTGATATDVTNQVDRSTVLLCERVSRILGLDICGIDIITPEISHPLPDEGAGIIEVNSSPGIRMHLFPTEGIARNVAQPIVDMLFPNGTKGRIPIISVTGTNGKTTVTRIISHVLSLTGKTTGMSTTEGIYIGGGCVERGDTTGARSARTILADPAVEVAVLEIARGGLLRDGLGYDWSDVGVLTNIREDHIGQDGIESLRDLIHIKSLVAERVREGGTVVLNADEPCLATLPTISDRLSGRLITFFSMDPDSDVVRAHCKRGGEAVYARDQRVIYQKSGGR